MPKTLSYMTVEQLEALPNDGKRYELVRGELKMMSPAGGRHGQIAMKLSRLISNFVEEHKLGVTFAAETGFLIHTNPDTVRAPDVAYVSEKNLGEFAGHLGYLPVAPELVGEVVSPGDRPSEVEEKANAWVQAGVQCVLVVDPQTKTICEYKPDEDAQERKDGLLDLDRILPGFKFDVKELFA